MVEETEHKTVAYDTWMAYSGRYLPRAKGVLHGTFHVVGYGLIAMFTALRKDRLWPRLRTLAELLGELGAQVRHVGPYLVRAMLPGYDPRRDEDPAWQRARVMLPCRLVRHCPCSTRLIPASPVPFNLLPEEA